MKIKGTYGSVHNWMHQFEKSNKCKFCGTTESNRYEWAMVKGAKYERRRENFIELCVRCHRKYDDSIKKAQMSRRRPVIAISSDKATRFESMSEASRQLGVLTTSICNCLHGRAKTAGGYRWEYVKN